MPAPDSVIKLCETFAEHREHFRSGNYNEFQLRKQFLDPLFEALGWDMANSQGLAPQYRDVIHEDAIKVGLRVKAPDYAFTLHGQRKFFLEAKKPSVNIKTDIAPAYQLRRYAWSAKLPLSILSDFEEFAIYDCRIKPAPTDASSKARTFYCTYDQYAEKWDEIAAIFSRDAILKGSFDKYADSAKKKKGTAEVDTAFLEEIERWRDLLAKNFALRNPTLTVRDLNFAVQKTIDRLVFLRICEDRGTEDYGRLRVCANGTQTYARLLELFRAADARYNSGLFHFSKEKSQAEEPDTLTPNLALDDKTLKDIISHLYYPESPYEFSVLPADILGSVYERFLGKTIRLTDGHQAKIEEKPEVRKAGGVYYTPSYIVDYIVENTLGKLLNPEPQKPISLADAAKLKVCDPACGSGSFLIVAYQYLLDWYRDRYCENTDKFSKGKNAVLYQAKGGEWRLTTSEKKRILLNNIHGVDIDAAAVEVTKLSLLLKVLEGETGEIAQRDFLKERERILPDLAHNIKCGNSLIGPDFYDAPELDFLDEEARYRVNVFDWKAAFPEVFKQGGFDCVIGNPPWVSLKGKFGNDILHEEAIKYLGRRFSGDTYRPNLFELFIRVSLELISKTGFHSFVVPDRFGFNQQFADLRRYILESFNIRSLQYRMPFPNITADTLVYVVCGDAVEKLPTVIRDYNEESAVTMTKDAFLQIQDFQFLPINALIRRLYFESSPLVPISQLASSAVGFISTPKTISILQNSPNQQNCLKGRDITRWSPISCHFFHFTRPNLAGGTQNEERLKTKEKVLLRKTGFPLIAAYDDSGALVEQSLYFFYEFKEGVTPKLLTAIFNSKIFQFVYWNWMITNRDATPQLKKIHLDRFPIRPIDFNNPADVEKHDRIVTLVDKMLALVPKRRAEANPQAAAQLDTQITATDRQIDRHVYELYGLTEEEIALVEGAIAIGK